MIHLINLFALIPLLGFLLSLLLPKHKENAISGTALITIGIQFLTFITFLVIWLTHKHPAENVKDMVLYADANYSFFIDFYFDQTTAVFLGVGSFLTYLVVLYCRTYMHREKGYKRFFNTILLFFLGYNVTVLSGNFETLFAGWEILGISSFLLIAFYRQRYLPVRNALKVFSIYRVGDVGILLAMWMSHHLWHQNVTFEQLTNAEMVSHHLANHSALGIFISLMVLVAAAAKSAQLPFSSWLPRAMEGPTPSSAIFYGSLSINMGVFLLLRTFPFWEHQYSVRVVIVVLGLSTSIVASYIARVQSSIKSQVAYGSISQIGLIFIEVALGWHTLALIHFMGNAFLRTYQLLVSPSVVSYLIREQFYNVKEAPKRRMFKSKKLYYNLYILSLKEWGLDRFLFLYIWSPLKGLGLKMNFLGNKIYGLFFGFIFLLGVVLMYLKQSLPGSISNYVPMALAIIALMMVLKSFSERKNLYLAWALVIAGHFWIALALSFNEQFTFNHILLYLGGVSVAGIIGFIILFKLQKKEGKIDLNLFHGHVFEHPRYAMVFLLACLGISGFPITTTFIGEDLIFTHIRENQLLLALVVSLCFIVDGIAIVRIYARVFLGPHAKTYHEIAYRSS